MEENQGNYTVTSEETSVSSQSAVSFPSVNQESKKSGNGKTLLILGLLVVVAVVGFVIFKNSSSKKETEEDPFITQENSVTATPEPVATQTPKPIDKTKIKIEIQNGTGVTGEAAYLQNQLKSLDYKNFIIGNASSQNETTTTVTFSKTLDENVVSELTGKLKELYKSVEVKTSSTIKTDVLVVTGLKKGATAKASATPVTTSTVKATSTATAKASTSPSPTATSN